MADAEVTVPPVGYPVSADIAAIWDLTGNFIEVIRIAAPSDSDLYSAMLSRIGREIRRKYGVAAAQALFHGLADSQREVSRFDRPASPP